MNQGERMQERERETWIWEMHIARVSFKCLDTYGHQHVYTLHLCSCLQEPHRHGELKVRCDQSLTHVDPKMIKISEEHRRTQKNSKSHVAGSRKGQDGTSILG